VPWDLSPEGQQQQTTGFGLKNGSFKGAINIPVAASYEFKYAVDGEWMNEPEADGYQWNDFAGADNSVLTL